MSILRRPRAQANAAGEVLLSRQQMLLVYTAAGYGFGFSSMQLLLLPLRARQLGASAAVIGLLVGATSLLAVPIAPPVGALIDRIGPRRAYAYCTALAAAFTLAVATTSSYWVMFALLLLGGIPSSIPWIAAQTYISRVGTPDKRLSITGRFSFCANAGAFAAPLLMGGVAQFVGYQYGFVFLALVAAAFAVNGFAMPELPSGNDGSMRARGSGFGAAGQLLQLRGIQVLLLISLARVWIWTIWPAFYPLYLSHQGISTFVIGTILATRSGIATLTTLQSGRIGRYLTPEVGAGCTVVLMVAGVVISPMLHTLPLVFLPAIIIGIGDGLNLPLLLAIIADVARPDQRGVAMALRIGANNLASTVAPITIGPLIPLLGLAAGFGVGGIVACALVAVGLQLYKGERRRAALVVE